MNVVHTLGRKLLTLVDAGIIPRAEYDSLYEVLVEAKNLLPQHAADVDRAVQLIERLLPDPQRTTSGLGTGVYMLLSKEGVATSASVFYLPKPNHEKETATSGN